MSDTRFVPVDEVEREPAKAPSRWKNRWVAIHAGVSHCCICQTPIEYGPGDILTSHCKVYPSAAEAAADLRNLESEDEWTRDWLGAFPIEDT